MPSDPHHESSTLIHEATAGQTSLVGTTLNRRYLVEKELKRGGFGIVYLARDQQLHSRPVVVKVLLEDAYQSDYVVQKFRQEIEALSRLDHPGVVGIIDSGELANGKPFIVMQYVDGVTLRSVMTAEGMDLDRCADLIKQMGRALTAAHEKGIFHRDLKPDNVMLQNLGQGEEQVKIIDFGIAKIKNSVIAPSTATNVAAGTVAYMAPEQLSSRPVSAVTDVYALGQIAYEMLTGRKPFNPETGFELLGMQRGGVRIKPSDLRPSLSTAADQLILKAMSFEPSQRPTKARDFGDKLARALNSNLETVDHSQSVQESLQTQQATEATPLAVRSGASLQKTIRATLPINPQSAFDSRAAGTVGAAKRSTWFRPGIILGVIFGLALLALGAWYVLINKSAGHFVTSPPVASVSTRELTYSLTVQKMRDGKPYQDQFQSSGQEIFENGWKFKMSISSPQEGYLYLLNEGPAANGTTTYNLLFPEPKTNAGSAKVIADNKLQTAWMTFDDHQGKEQFWLVWSISPIKELEAVTGAVNQQDQGQIKDPALANSVRDFLANHSSPKPEVAKDSAKEQSTVKGKGDLLISFIELEHH